MLPVHGSNVNFCLRELIGQGEDGITMAISPGQRESLVTTPSCVFPSGSSPHFFLLLGSALGNAKASYISEQQVEQLMLLK